jgi:hypothetical protein
MVLILALDGVAGIAALPRTVKVAAEVPAPGPLAQIAADRALIPELRTGSRPCGLRQRRVLLSHGRVPGHFTERGQCSDPESTGRNRRDAPQRLEPAQADEARGFEHVVPEAPEQIGAAGVHPRAG